MVPGGRVVGVGVGVAPPLAAASPVALGAAVGSGVGVLVAECEVGGALPQPTRVTLMPIRHGIESLLSRRSRVDLGVLVSSVAARGAAGTFWSWCFALKLIGVARGCLPLPANDTSERVLSRYQLCINFRQSLPKLACQGGSAIDRVVGGCNWYR